MSKTTCFHEIAAAQSPAHVDALVDESIGESFPASDPPAVTPERQAPGRAPEGEPPPEAPNPDLPVPPGKGPTQPIGTPQDPDDAR